MVKRINYMLQNLLVYQLFTWWFCSQEYKKSVVNNKEIGINLYSGFKRKEHQVCGGYFLTTGNIELDLAYVKIKISLVSTVSTANLFFLHKCMAQNKRSFHSGLLYVQKSEQSKCGLYFLDLTIVWIYQ